MHLLNLGLKYTSSTLVIHYYYDDHSQEYVHKVKVFLKKNATAISMAKELIGEEPMCFSSKVVQKKQLVRLIQKLIHNKGKTIEKRKLKARIAPAQGNNDNQNMLMKEPSKTSLRNRNDVQNEETIKMLVLSEEVFSLPEEDSNLEYKSTNQHSIIYSTLHSQQQ